ncbi:MAG TPA: MaoC family dehydratase N-terminal domain-containing protein [Candidatus Binataceae bacterium]|nr:MaoC family dehydratase N-terminal domain-containing protein [Candidatus Binataceae bacterium]
MSDDVGTLLARRFNVGEPVTVTVERIAEFCKSVGENNPLFLDPVAAAAGPYGGIVAPPAYAESFRRTAPYNEEGTWFPRGGLMAGIDIEFLQPIRPGDTISTTIEVKETYEKTGRTGTMLFTIIRSTLMNQKNEAVAHIDRRMMNRKR